MKNIIKLITFWIPIKHIRKNSRNYLLNLLDKKIKIINKKLVEALHNNEKIVFCPAGQGDTFLTLGFKNVLEHEYGKICWVIRPNHKIIAKMFNLKNYVIANEEELFSTWVCRKLYPKANDIYDVASETLKIQENKIFVAHPYYTNKGQHCDRKYKEFKKFIADFLNIPINSEFNYPHYNISMNEDFSKKIHRIVENLDNLAIICPEHGQCEEIDFGVDFWKQIVCALNKKGYVIIQNSKNEDKAIDGAICLPMITDDLIPLCLKSKMVISSRSGLCDVIHTKGANLIVITPTKELYDICGLNETFDRTDINEIIYSDNTLDKITDLINKSK